MTVKNVTDYKVDTADRTKVYAWEGMTTGDTGRPINVAQWADKSVHVFGNFGSGASVPIEGSNDPRANPKDADHASAVWQTLTDAQGNALTFSSANLEQILENTWWIRPGAVVSGTNPSINVVIAMKRTN